MHGHWLAYRVLDTVRFNPLGLRKSSIQIFVMPFFLMNQSPFCNCNFYKITMTDITIFIFLMHLIL